VSSEDVRIGTRNDGTGRRQAARSARAPPPPLPAGRPSAPICAARHTRGWSLMSSFRAIPRKTA
jgi:hypothetical protein